MDSNATIHPSLVKAVALNAKVLLGGSFLSIDPSSGSPDTKKWGRGSMPGYAIFRRGHLYKAGQIQVPKELLKGINYCPHRLQFIANKLRVKFPREFKLLVIECIHYKPNRKTNMKSFQQLNQSVGAITAALQWKRILNVLPYEWKKVAGIYHIKGDAMDAIQIGQTVIEIARNLAPVGSK